MLSEQDLSLIMRQVKLEGLEEGIAISVRAVMKSLDMGAYEAMDVLDVRQQLRPTILELLGFGISQLAS